MLTSEQKKEVLARVAKEINPSLTSQEVFANLLEGIRNQTKVMICAAELLNAFVKAHNKASKKHRHYLKYKRMYARGKRK